MDPPILFTSQYAEIFTCLISFREALVFGLPVADPIFQEATLYGTKPIRRSWIKRRALVLHRGYNALKLICMGGKILQNRSSRLKSAKKKKIAVFHIEERSHFWSQKRGKKN